MGSPQPSQRANLPPLLLLLLLLMLLLLLLLLLLLFVTLVTRPPAWHISSLQHNNTRLSHGCRYGTGHFLEILLDPDPQIIIDPDPDSNSTYCTVLVYSIVIKVLVHTRVIKHKNSIHFNFFKFLFVSVFINTYLCNSDPGSGSIRMKCRIRLHIKWYGSTIFFN